MENFKCFDKNWKKTGSSNFEAFNEKNPNLSTNKDDIRLAYTLSENEYVCNVTIDGKSFAVKMAYDGTMENKHFNGTSYYIVSTRNSDDSGKKMIFTESGKGVSMTTTFEAC